MQVCPVFEYVAHQEMKRNQYRFLQFICLLLS